MGKRKGWETVNLTSGRRKVNGQREKMGIDGNAKNKQVYVLVIISTFASKITLQI